MTLARCVDQILSTFEAPPRWASLSAWRPDAVDHVFAPDEGVVNVVLVGAGGSRAHADVVRAVRERRARLGLPPQCGMIWLGPAGGMGARIDFDLPAPWSRCSVRVVNYARDLSDSSSAWSWEGWADVVLVDERQPWPPALASRLEVALRRTRERGGRIWCAADADEVRRADG